MAGVLKIVSECNKGCLQANAYLTVEEGTGIVSVDPSTGNEVAGTNERRVPAFILRNERFARNKDFAGVDTNHLPIHGFLLEAIEGFAIGRFQATWTLAEGSALNGFADIHAKAVPPGAGLGAMIPIEGTFDVIGSGV